MLNFINYGIAVVNSDKGLLARVIENSRPVYLCIYFFL